MLCDIHRSLFLTLFSSIFHTRFTSKKILFFFLNCESMWEMGYMEENIYREKK